MTKNNSLINRAACHDFCLKWAQEKRSGWKPTRVSRQFLDDLNCKVRLLIQSSVNSHRSIGKTVMDLH